MLDGKRILITGGSGSFGRRFVQRALKDYQPKRLIIFSRDEYKMSQLQQEFAKYGDKVDYFIGDVRDAERCRRAFRGCDIVIHAAAMKQIPMCEAHPFEAINTNILGGQNVCTAALDREVEKVVFLSTDKAVSPVNLYGTTKLAAEKVAIGANIYSGGSTVFSVVRYGNVAGSRGSVIPYFRSLVGSGERTLPVTDQRMTRFWLSLDDAVNAVLLALEIGAPGCIYIPKMPSFKITDLVCALGCIWTQVGVRPGEKLHESMLGEYEHLRTYDNEGYYAVAPQVIEGATNLVPEGFRYSTDTNDRFMDVEEIKKCLASF